MKHVQSSPDSECRPITVDISKLNRERDCWRGSPHFCFYGTTSDVIVLKENKTILSV